MRPATLARRPLLLVWLLGLLAFRLHFLIVTHNSVPLSAVLSAIFVLLPASIAQKAYRACAQPAPALPTRKPLWVPRPPARRAVLANVAAALAVVWLCVYGLRVRPVDFDATKLPVGGRYFIAVNFWDNEVARPPPARPPRVRAR